MAIVKQLKNIPISTWLLIFSLGFFIIGYLNFKFLYFKKIGAVLLALSFFYIIVFEIFVRNPILKRVNKDEKKWQ